MSEYRDEYPDILIQQPFEHSSLAAEMLFEWSQDPIQGIRDLFQVEPTEQQKDLILSTWMPFSRVAVSSCTGSGKTASLTWLTFLLLMTQQDCRVLVTSPSFQQLTRVYQAELRKWHNKMPKKLQDAFEITRERVVFKTSKTVNEANLVTASAENKESLQGGHAENYIILADEASGIDEATFGVLQRTLSTGNGGRFILTSNPTRSSGNFYDIFHRDLAAWKKLRFTAAGCPHIAPTFIQEMIDMYGEDSDHYRIAVLGEFPRASSTQFIRADVVSNTIKNQLELREYHEYPKVMGVDVARFGDDETVFVIRQGPKILDITTHKHKDTQEVSALALEYYRRWGAEIVCIDGIGVGAGVVDRCKALKMPIFEVIGSHKSSRPLEYFNMRTQLWGEMRQWLDNGADIPFDDDLREQLVSMTYGFNSKMQIALTTKEQLKKKGLKSPDRADAIALTFATDAYKGSVKRAHARKVKKSKRYFI